MSYRGRAQSDQSTRNFLGTHYYFKRFTKCPLCAKIFLGAGDTKILKGVKKAGDKINTEKGCRSITSLQNRMGTERTM